MQQAFYVGAYWGARQETAEQCALRLSMFLTTLGQTDETLGSWFKPAGQRKAALARPVDKAPDALRALFLTGQTHRDDSSRTVIAELGFSASLWNGQRNAAKLRVRCGASTTTSGLTSNTLVLQMPTAEGEALQLFRRDAALKILRSVIDCWAPSWCTWTSHDLRAAQGAQPEDVVAGWATYVAEPARVEVARLPAETTIERIGQGLLVLSGGNADTATATTVAAIRQALV